MDGISSSTSAGYDSLTLSISAFVSWRPISSCAWRLISFRQMRRHDGRRIDDRIAGQFRPLLHRFVDPEAGRPKAGSTVSMPMMQSSSKPGLIAK